MAGEPRTNGDTIHAPNQLIAKWAEVSRTWRMLDAEMVALANELNQPMSRARRRLAFLSAMLWCADMQTRLSDALILLEVRNR